MFNLIPTPGVKLGAVEFMISPVTKKLKVGILVRSWPYWGFAAAAAGMTVAWMHGTTPFGIRLARSSEFPTVSSLTEVEPVDVLLCDDVDWKDKHVLSCLKCRVVIVQGLQRHRKSDGHLRPTWFRIRHRDTGGVSTATLKFAVYTLDKDFSAHSRSLKIPTYPPSTLRSVVSCTVDEGAPRTSPSAQSGIQVLEGYYPLGSRVRVLAPCVVAYPRFRERFLTRRELWDVLDLPSGYAKSLIHVDDDTAFGFAVPLKPCSVLLQHLFMFRPGGEGTTTPCSTLESVPKLSSNLERPCEENKQSGKGTGAPPTVPSTKPERSFVKEREQSEVEENKEERNAKAAKADDAKVPVHIWRGQLSRITGTTLTEDWETSAEHLREQLMTVYRRMLFRSFLLWRKRKYKSLERGLDWLTRLLWWNDGKAKMQEKAYARNRCVKFCASSGTYEWTGNGRGLLQYQVEHQAIWKVEPLDLKAARDCMVRASAATWWEWAGGSRLHFWRWGAAHLGNYACEKDARDGAPVFFVRSKLPKYFVPQSDPKNPEDIPKMRAKLDKFRTRRYLNQDTVKSLISYFYVDKNGDIRPVFNGTSCGLNAATFAPWFPLPTVETHLRSVEKGTWLADEDLGEMFYNFLLDPRIRNYTGVDVTPYYNEVMKGEHKKLWLVWSRLIMGFSPSPYLATQQLLRAHHFLIGDRRDESNPFHWERIVLNLPGMETYDPRRPRVYKVRKDGSIAADVHTYIDDLRISAPTMAILWKACQQIASRLNHLGMQHAARKLRELMQDPGAWAGSVVHTSEGVHVLISLERWEKTKTILASIKVELSESGTLHFKNLESWRGYLIYVARTYPAMRPYLKGLHQTLDSWRANRGKDGWKLSYRELKLIKQRKRTQDRQWEMNLARRGTEVEVEPVIACEGAESAPDRVSPAPRLRDDLDALMHLTEAEEPPKRCVRAKHVWGIAYGFGDASGGGGGSGIEHKNRTRLRFFVWCESGREKSSNYRECLNLVLGLEAEHGDGRLRGVEVFIFTDNIVTEGAYFKGASTSKELHGLILRLRKIEMEGEMILHIIHISGTRMIQSGIDGLSRGDTHEGVAVGKKMLSFVELHRSPIQRSPHILQWVKSWWPRKQCGDLNLLSPEDWFLHDREKLHANCLWMIPPAAGDVAVEEMAKWRHAVSKRHIHVFIIPRQWTLLSRKALRKASDWHCEIPLDWVKEWGHEMFEPLLIGLSFPKFDRYPFEIKEHPLMDDMEGQVRRLRKGDEGPDFGTVLRQFCIKAGKISGV